MQQAKRAFASRKQAEKLIAALQDANVQYSLALRAHLKANGATVGKTDPDFSKAAETLDAAYSAILKALTQGVEEGAE